MRKDSCPLLDVGAAFLSYQADCLVKVAGSCHAEWPDQGNLPIYGLALKKLYADTLEMRSKL